MRDMLPIYTRVKARTDRLSGDGVERGRTGYVIEIYEDGGYEVEFSNPDGSTILLTSMSEDELELAEPESPAGG